MAEETGEIPAVVARLLDDGSADVREAAAHIRAASPRWVVAVGRGSSDHAATYARYLAETRLGLPAGLAAPAVTTLYGARIDWRDGLVIAVSQSGASPDVAETVAAARAGGAVTVAITNEAG
ncbi:MAG TPA: SIS domain-containing protein, partial [Candidatus Limnocylindrales bacterium]|nr:SIS domain-containing protein [Candidatus Limnocylindrales bacterium]